MSLWSRVVSAGSSLVRTVAPAIIPGASITAAAVSLSRSSRSVGIALGSGVEGVVGGVAGLLGSGAQSWAERHTRNGMSFVTGIDLNNLNESEQRLADGSRTVGNVAGIGATLFIPGGIAVRGAGLALRGVEAASVLARAPGAARAAGYLAEGVARVNPLLTNGIARTIGVIPGINATGRIAVGAGVIGRELLLGEMDNRIFNPLFPASSGPARTGGLRANFADAGGNVGGAGGSEIIPAVYSEADAEHVRTIFNAESPNIDSARQLTQSQLATIARDTNTVIVQTIPTLTPEQLQNLTIESAQLMQPLLHTPPLEYTRNADVIRFQAAAKAAGLYTGEVDGLAGPLTRAAMERLSSPAAGLNAPQVAAGQPAPVMA